MTDLTQIIDKDGLIHVYYWGPNRPTSYPSGGYGANQYKGLPWSVTVDGTDGRDVSPDAVYHGIGDTETVSITETKTTQLEIAVANGRVGSEPKFKLSQRNKPDQVSGAIAPGSWAMFTVEIGSEPTDYDISVVGGDDPKFQIRYRSKG
jgi:hypothetical protein